MNKTEGMTKHLRHYFKLNVDNKQLLTSERQQELFESVKKGSIQAKEEIFNSYKPLVLNLAKKKANAVGADDQLFGDLYQEASIALYKSIINCNNSNSFVSYAKTAINNALNEFVRNNHLIVVPIEVYRLNAKINEFKINYYHENGYYPEDEVVINELDIDAQRYYELESFIYETESYDAISESQLQYLDNFGYSEDYLLKAFLKDVIEDLQEERDKYIVINYLGLDGNKMTFDGIAKKLGVTKQFVSQRYKKITLELSEKFKEDIEEL